MNRFFLGVLAFLVLASSAFATPAACVPGTLDTYAVMGFSCSINSLTFGLWSYIGSGTAAIPSSAIEVTPITTTGNEGFDFSTFWSVDNFADPGVLMNSDSKVFYTVMGSGINAVSLSAAGIHTLGTGVASVAETYCVNGQIATCPTSPPPSIGITNPPPSFSDRAFFASSTSVSVLKDIGVSTGRLGSASMSDVTNQFSNSPEPLSFVLLGTGLLGLGLLRKRMKH